MAPVLAHRSVGTLLHVLCKCGAVLELRTTSLLLAKEEIGLLRSVRVGDQFFVLEIFIYVR